MKKLFFILLCLSYSATYACSLAPATETFIVDNTLAKTLPVAPTFKVSTIYRGKKALHSCSGLASLHLKLDTPTSHEQGYIFEIVEGSFKKIRFQGVPITTTQYSQDKHEFIFSFYEMKNEPINFTLKITSVSKSGLKSQPQLLKVSHKGAKKSVRPSWSQRVE